MDKEAFWNCLAKAGEQFTQQAEDTTPAVEEEDADMEEDGELAALVARKMGLL